MYGYKLKHEILGAYASYQIECNKQGLLSDHVTKKPKTPALSL